MPEKLIELSGGLTLLPASISAPDGSLRDCLNMERDQGPGYIRRQGLVIYNGTVCGPELDDFMVFFVNPGTGTFQYGEQVVVHDPLHTNNPDVRFLCLGETAQSQLYPGARSLILAYPWMSGYPNPTNFVYPNTVTFTGQTSGAFRDGTVISQQSLTSAFFTYTQLEYLKGFVEDAHSYALTHQPSSFFNGTYGVPGSQISPVDAIFGYNDNVYTIHDCQLWPVVNGTMTGAAVQTPLDGHVVKNVGGAITYGKLLQIKGDSAWAGTTNANLVLYDVKQNVMPNNGDSLSLYSADGTTLVKASFCQVDFLSTPDMSQTRALLYATYEQYVAGDNPNYPTRAIPHDWTRPRLIRELPYTTVPAAATPINTGFGPTGVNTFSIYEYTRQGLTSTLSTMTPITTAATYSGTGGSSAAGWTNPDNARVQDAAVATLVAAFSTNTPYITLTKFDFSAIPDNSIILGITAIVRCRAAAANTVYDNDISLVLPDGTTISQNKARWLYVSGAALTDYTYGSANDVWGLQLTTQLIKNQAFGVRLRFGITGAATASVDDISLAITYVPSSRFVYIRNALAAAPTDIPAKVIHYSIDSGTFASNTAVGTLTIDTATQTLSGGVSVVNEFAGTNAGLSRVVGSGEEIRDAAGGAGNLLGYTTGGHYPISFPASSALSAQAPSARYETIDANFFDDVNARAAFIVNGVEYATMFDGTYFVRIRTGRRMDQDNPRHVAAHLGYLHLGYLSGSVVNTGTGRPLSVIGAIGSGVTQFGERITGLQTVNGQTLGVWTDKTTRGLQGTNPNNYAQIMISPAVGAIEYTVVNLAGEAVWASYRGIETLRTVNAYGDFETLPLSEQSSPWLRPRLQSDNTVTVILGRPLYALACVNKRQYRLYFSDGYAYFQTLLPNNSTEGTIHYYSLFVSLTTKYPIVFRHLSRMVRSDGKEILLGAPDRSPQPEVGAVSPYIPLTPFRVDCGNLDIRFVNGLNKGMMAYVELNAIYPDSPIKNNWFGTLTVFSNALTGTVFTVYKQVNDDGPLVPLPSGTTVFFPDTSGVYAGKARIPFPSQPVAIDLAAEGHSLRARIDVSLLPTTMVGFSRPRITHANLTYNPLEPLGA